VLNVVAWILAVLVFDAPFALIGFVVFRHRRRHRRLRARIAAYGHLVRS